ncbi:MAG: hypothetical protein ABW277_20190 [Longimicrobiaceae bacterium]
MIEIRDDEEIPTENFHALFKALGFRTQSEAAEVLGLKQGYVSELWTGKKRVQPCTSLHKLIQLLYRDSLREQR